MFTLYTPSSTHFHSVTNLEIVENGAKSYMDMSAMQDWKVIASGTKRQIFTALIEMAFNWDATVTVNYADGNYKVLSLRDIRNAAR